jgi:hypothetical protein
VRNLLTKIPLFLLFAIIGCKGMGDHPVPNVAVNVQINILLPSYSALQSVGGYAYVNGGVKGLIVYRRSISEFAVYDRMSTASGGFDCTPLEVDTDNYLFLNDACSNAVYSLIDGSLVSGDAIYGLRSYQSNFDGYSILAIYN